MPLTKRHTAWTPAEDKGLLECCNQGLCKSATAAYLNEQFHVGRPVRNENAVSNRRSELGYKVARIPKVGRIAPIQGSKEQEVEREETEDRITLKSRGSRIRTVAELLAHANVTGEIVKQTVKTWDTTLVEGGESKTVQNFAIHVEVRPNSTSVTEAVQKVIDGAFAARKPVRMVSHSKVSQTGLMQVLGVFDPHFAKLAWNKETGHGDYDLNIATREVRQGTAYLIGKGDAEKVESRHILLGGDVFHYDTPQGTTTKGTPLERDGRVQRMIEEGSKCLFDAIEASAETCPTVVYVVPGNHDFVLSWALQRILASHFRNDRRVAVDNTFTERKYLQWGACLLGLTHGDKSKKVLPSLMAREAPTFSTSLLRHWHRGHLHCRRAIETIEGVTVYDHPSVSTADNWHNSEGFLSERGMDAFYYHKAGALTGTHVYTPGL